MLITKKDVFEKLQQYLNHRITIENLIDCAEDVMMEYDSDNQDRETLMPIVAQIGLADFGLLGFLWKIVRGSFTHWDIK